MITWDAHNDEYLARLVRMRQPVGKIAARFSCTEEEIIVRVQQLQNEKKIPLQDGRPIVQPEDEKKEPEAPRDPLQEAFVDMCAAYERTGEQMAFMGRLLSMNLTIEQLMSEAANMEAFHAKLVGKKLPLHTFILRMLWDHYMFVPRPRVQPPAPKQEPDSSSTTDAPAQS